MLQDTVPPCPPVQVRLTRDIEVRGVEVLSRRQRYISTVLHFPVLAKAAAAKSAEKDKKRGKIGVEVWGPDSGRMREEKGARQLTWCV